MCIYICIYTYTYSLYWCQPKRNQNSEAAKTTSILGYIWRAMDWVTRGLCVWSCCSHTPSPAECTASIFRVVAANPNLPGQCSAKPMFIFMYKTGNQKRANTSDQVLPFCCRMRAVAWAIVEDGKGKMLSAMAGQMDWSVYRHGLILTFTPILFLE